MPECENCGSHVTERYLRVKEPEHRKTVRCCPSCPDILWDNGKVRKSKGLRRSER